MENTFSKEITFLSKVLGEDSNAFVEGNVTKPATFKELSQTDKSQHKLHFMISAIFDIIAGKGGAEDKVIIDSDKLYDLAERAINILLVPAKAGDPGVNETEKAEILNDSFALLRFGRWFADNKATPFFLTSIVR